MNRKCVVSLSFFISISFFILFFFVIDINNFKYSTSIQKITGTMVNNDNFIDDTKKQDIQPINKVNNRI